MTERCTKHHIRRVDMLAVLAAIYGPRPAPLFQDEEEKKRAANQTLERMVIDSIPRVATDD